MVGIEEDRLASMKIAEAEKEGEGPTREEAREARERVVVFKVFEGLSKSSRSFHKIDPSDHKVIII
jgi:hypothetical protein